jgi:hypothetical protein
VARRKSFKRLQARAEALGVADQLAELFDGYLDAVEAADSRYAAFHWGERSNHSQLHRHPWPDPVMEQLGELVEVVYETSKGGEVYHWQHPFSAPRPVLAYGGNGNLWILGGSYKVNRRGIVG